MTQAADALHGNEVAGHCAAVAECVIGGNSGIEQGRGLSVTEAVGNRHQRFHGSQHVFLISAVIADAAHLYVATIAKIAPPALAAGAIMTTMPADAHALTLFPRSHARANFIHHARNFVSGNAGILKARPQAFFDEHIAVADATGVDLDADLSRVRLWDRTLDDFKLRSGFRNLCSLHGCYFWFRCDSQRCHILLKVLGKTTMNHFKSERSPRRVIGKRSDSRTALLLLDERNSYRLTGKEADWTKVLVIPLGG